ncbi:MAG: hypothetical protein AAFZ15_31615 [Bacteroidota bacterium]
MIKLAKWLFLSAMFLFAGCEAGTPTQSENDTTQPATDSTVTTGSETPTLPTTKPECEINGSILEENLFWSREENELVAIVADESTVDPDLGESHRILEVYDGEDCDRILRNVLPVNRSPDFPYYLSEITYNNVSQLIAIQGFSHIYIFDLIKKQLSKPLKPNYLNERYAEDAQSGMIQVLELWENYLVGYANGEGTFVFDLSNSMQAAPVLPTAELELEEGISYNSLFFLKTDEGTHQAILPKFDLNTGEFQINPLFDKPINVQTNINPSFRDNQYLVFKQLLGGSDRRPIGIDMKAMKKLDIPTDMETKKDTEIINWMKQQ